FDNGVSQCFKEQQDCGCSNWEDKPGAKGDHSTGIVLVIKVTFPLYLKNTMKRAQGLR
uniref:Uncharacterized protein n=1 Tax=Anser brachyrhynchus TaxID=132585 RepID=A0A8B9BJ90_9AVES